MEPSTRSFFLLFFLLLISPGYLKGSPLRRHLHGGRRRQEKYDGLRLTKLFAFGDSYADTGNERISPGKSWKEPYGTTFPRKPAGRYSDGRVLTDYLARFMGLNSPYPYTWREVGQKKLGHGMNFAFGGSGVFDTYSMVPNMTTQIGFFQNLLKTPLYTKRDLHSSLVLVCLAGNDYGVYLARGGTMEGIKSFISSVINQLEVNLKRIHNLGVAKIAVTTLPPTGCLPRTTQMSSYKKCNSTQNLAAEYHNFLVQQAVARLNKASKTPSFFIIDLYRSFTAVLNQRHDHRGNMKFKSPLKPCCIGVSSEDSCGSVDESGAKRYTVCSDPKSAFFWDQLHPTQAGWEGVYMALKSTLERFLN